MNTVDFPEPAQTCSRCLCPLSPAALVCPHCAALVHAARLEQLSASARSHEQRQAFAEARADWLSALELLPPESAQAAWVRDNSKRLGDLAAGTSQAVASHSWARKWGPLAPVIILLAKGKWLLALLKLKFLLSLGSFIAFYWALYGAKFGVGFAALILIHEMGHFIEIKRRGLPADMPVFLPGFGAYVRWSALGVTAHTRAFVSLAGPMAGAVGAAVCALLWMQTHDAFWIGLASLSALLNVLNLIPVWVLDGGQAIGALNKTERIVLTAGALLLAALLSQPVFLLVAAGAGYRVFNKDIPAQSGGTLTAYYLLLLAVLGYIMELAPALPPGP